MKTEQVVNYYGDWGGISAQPDTEKDFYINIIKLRK